MRVSEDLQPYLDQLGRLPFVHRGHVEGPAVVLDTPPSLVGATVRQIAAAAGGASPQTAADVRHGLLARGVLHEARPTLGWAPGGFQRALDLFLAGFGAMAPSGLLGNYRARPREPEAVEAALIPALPHVGDWRWGGGAGAYRLMGHDRGNHTLIYVRQADAAAPARLPLIPDATGNVTIRQIPASAALDGATPDTVHPALLYADLMAEGNERAREAAAEVHGGRDRGMTLPITPGHASQLAALRRDTKDVDLALAVEEAYLPGRWAGSGMLRRRSERLAHRVARHHDGAVTAVRRLP